MEDFSASFAGVGAPLLLSDDSGGAAERARIMQDVRQQHADSVRGRAMNNFQDSRALATLRQQALTRDGSGGEVELAARRDYERMSRSGRPSRAEFDQYIEDLLQDGGKLT